jgi:mycothiol synthase
VQSRPATIEDAPAIHGLTRRWEEYWNAPLVTPLFEVVEELARPHFDIALDTRSVWDGDRLVAFGDVWHRPSEARQERAYAFGRVDPEYRGRGIGRELFAWQLARGSELLRAQASGLTLFFRADEWDWIDDAHRLYHRFGLEPVRYFTEMLKPLGDREAEEPLDGFEVRAWDRSLEEEAREVMNQAFADHWGSTPTDKASFEYRLEGSGVRLDLSHLALADGSVIGLVLNSHFPEDEELLGRRDGWVETLGVLAGWRRRGVATALLKASFNSFLDAGMTHSAIGVDTESPTAAHSLYRGLGYVPTHRSITSEIEIT